MDLALTPAESAAAEATRAALAGGGRPPADFGSAGELVAASLQIGRLAGPTDYAAAALLHRLGRLDEPLTTTGLPTAAGVIDLVPRARTAASLLIVVDDTTVGEIALGHPEVTVEPQPSLADPGTSRVRYPAGAMRTQSVDTATAVLTATIVAAADAVGAATGALEATVDHVRRREQFGEPLATRQAVRHRCADMAIAVRLATDAVLDAAATVDRGDAGRGEVVAQGVLAVTRCCTVTAAAHQLAGGAGILADRPHHRWHRRVKAIEAALGPVRRHRAALGLAAVRRAQERLRGDDGRRPSNP